MARVSRALLDNIFNHYCTALKCRVAKSYNDVGGWRLHDNDAGVAIAVVANKNGALSFPCGNGCSPSQLLEHMQFTIGSIEAARR